MLKKEKIVSLQSNLPILAGIFTEKDGAIGVEHYILCYMSLDDNILEFEPFEDDGFVLIAAESSWRGMADELQELHNLKGAQFINQLKQIVYYGDFHPVEGETSIFSSIGDQNDDFENLINAARKAVEHGYRVYILPNPRGIRTADFIFERKGIYKMFDLKTITGKSSVGNRLSESIGQTNRVLLHMIVDYNPAALARSIKMYFESSDDALEVLILKGKKIISVTRNLTLSPEYYNIFMKRYIR